MHMFPPPLYSGPVAYPAPQQPRGLQPAKPAQKHAINSAYSTHSPH